MKRKFEEEEPTRSQDAECVELNDVWLPNNQLDDLQGGKEQQPQQHVFWTPQIGSFQHSFQNGITDTVLAPDSKNLFSFDAPFTTVTDFAYPSLSFLETSQDARNLFQANCVGNENFPPFAQSLLDEPSIVPASSNTQATDGIYPEKPSNSLHSHNLRPKRSARRATKLHNFEGCFDSASSSGEEFANNDEDIPVDDKPSVLKGESSKNTATVSIKIGKPGPKKKRPYYRKKNTDPEVLDKVNAERLEKKRLKNRVLAARSRDKKKKLMEALQKDNQSLRKKLSLVTEQLKACKSENAELKAKLTGFD